MTTQQLHFISLTLALLALPLTAVAAGGGSSTPPGIVPATVQQYSDETTLATITLTPKAKERLGIALGAATLEAVSRTRVFGGEVLVPPGQSITVFAPISGTLVAPGEGSQRIPLPGSRVAKGEPIVAFLPFLSPERSVLTPSERVQLAEARVSLTTAQITANGRLGAAQVELDAAKVAHTRAEKLLQDKVGSARALDEAKAKLDLAQKEWNAAQAQKRMLDETTLDSGTLTATDLTAPSAGVVNNLFGSQGQIVAAGTPLFEITNLDTIWVRVPIYVGDLPRIATGEDAYVGNLAAAQGELRHAAMAVDGPPSANAAAATVDLYYEMDNTEGTLRAGQKVSVALSLKSESESLVVPWDAVLHDVHGGAWVYAETGPTTYERRRVQVRYVLDGKAVLASGPDVGTPIVIDGAAELFGTEFGNGK